MTERPHDGGRRTLVVASFATSGAMLLLSLGTTILLARVLGPEGRGLLLALTFWPALLAAILNLSLNETVAYHVAQRAGSAEEAVAASTAFWLVMLAAAIAAALTVLAMTVVVQSQYRGYLGFIMLYAAVFVPLTHFDLFFRAILQGRGAILSLNLVRLIQPVFYLLLLVVCFAVGLLNVTVVMAVAVIAIAVSLIVGAALARVTISVPRAGLNGMVAGTGWTFHKANLLLYAASELDKVIVLILLTTAQAGLFAVAVAVSTIGTGVALQSLGLMLMRDMADSDGPAGQRRVFVANMRAAFAVLLLVNGAVAALAPWWMPLLFGAQFAAAVPATMLLLCMGALKGARQMVDKALRATHHTRTGMIGEAAALVGMALLGPIGALARGLEGIAVAAIISQAIAFGMVVVLANRHLSVTLVALWPFQRAALDDLRALIGHSKLPAPAA